MITTEQTPIIAALEVEIATSKRRLDAVYREVEDMRREKVVLADESDRLQKHITYLEGMSKEKETELAQRVAALNETNVTIKDKQEVLQVIQQKVTDSLETLSLKNKELSDVEATLLNHSKKMDSESHNVSELHRAATENHRTANEKLAKIKTFIESI
jgi:chromosome segregation ATPase